MSMKLRYGYIQEEMKKSVMYTNYASFKIASKQDSKIWFTFNFDFTIKPLQKVCLKRS